MDANSTRVVVFESINPLAIGGGRMAAMSHVRASQVRNMVAAPGDESCVSCVSTLILLLSYSTVFRGVYWKGG